MPAGAENLLARPFQVADTYRRSINCVFDLVFVTVVALSGDIYARAYAHPRRRGVAVIVRVEVLAGAADERSDAVLIAAVRGGDIAAYGVLYARHVGAARRFAALCTPTHAEREDMAARRT